MKVFIVIAVLFGAVLVGMRALQKLPSPQPQPSTQIPEIPPAPQGGAHTGLRLCNKTSSRVSVAIGYKDTRGWITEGWWNTTPGKCEVLQPGPLRAKFYYVYAIDADRGGEWGGRHVMCTQDKTFTIIGVEDCEKRGFTKRGFFEIDTGELQSWVIQLDESGRTGQHP